MRFLLRRPPQRLRSAFKAGAFGNEMNKARSIKTPGFFGSMSIVGVESVERVSHEAYALQGVGFGAFTVSMIRWRKLPKFRYPKAMRFSTFILLLQPSVKPFE